MATYREHGQALARGIGMNALMAEMYGKQEGCRRGAAPCISSTARRRFYGGNAIVGGGLPLAVGTAMGDKMLGRHRRRVLLRGWRSGRRFVP